MFHHQKNLSIFPKTYQPCPTVSLNLLWTYPVPFTHLCPVLTCTHSHPPHYIFCFPDLCIPYSHRAQIVLLPFFPCLPSPLVPLSPMVPFKHTGHFTTCILTLCTLYHHTTVLLLRLLVSVDFWLLFRTPITAAVNIGKVYFPRKFSYHHFQINLHLVIQMCPISKINY